MGCLIPRKASTNFLQPDHQSYFSKQKSKNLSFTSHIQSSVEKENNFKHEAQTTVSDFRGLLASKKTNSPQITQHPASKPITTSKFAPPII